MYADMAADSQGWPTEGVVHVDAMALAALLEVVGPVEIEGVEYTAETAPQLVLNEPYLAFDTLDARDERPAAQSNRAGALFEAIQSRASKHRGWGTRVYVRVVHRGGGSNEKQKKMK